MPTPGLSLVGFFTDPQRVIAHLRLDCVPHPPNASDGDLLGAWATAQGTLGQPFANAGNVNPQPLTPGMDTYVQALVAQPWVANRLQELNDLQASVGLPALTFQVVEIDPLLAYQISVDQDRSANNCQGLNNPPTEQQLLDTCLPNVQPQEFFHTSPVNAASRSVIIKLRNHNLQMHRWGIFDGAHGMRLAGVAFHVSLPFVHVVRWNDRCYLHNGYHRVYGLRTAGATHLPCVFRDVNSAEMAGIRTDGGTFNEALLTGPNPPTMAHYTQGRACTVHLRAKSRVLHVTWEQYSVPDEYD